MLKLKQLALVVALVAASGSLGAQAIRGLVVEKESGRPVPGAVFLMMDSAGVAYTRAVTNEHGAYFIQRHPNATRARVVRLGFRPRDISRAELDSAANSATDFVVGLIQIPQLLEPVFARANPSCKKRKDTEAAFGLWQQAKAGLVASVVARLANPAKATVLNYARKLDKDENFTSQEVTSRTGEWSMPFGAALSAAEFVEFGFVRNEWNGQSTFYGPDADVLLEDDFQIRYCFSIAKAEKWRPTQVGLAFAPANRQPARVDIEGTLWIDTLSRKLKEINYEYVVVGAMLRYKPGGHVYFTELGNGVPFVDSWTMRMVTMAESTDPRSQQRRMVVGRNGVRPPASVSSVFTSRSFSVTAGGGILAHALWPDGTKFDAALGTLKLKVLRRDGRPAIGLPLGLDSTTYRGVTDSTGSMVISDLAPGPYKVVYSDSALDHIGLKLGTQLAFTAAADSTVFATMFVPDAGATIARMCGATEYTGWSSVVARVATRDNKPVKGARWSFGDKLGTTVDNGIIIPCLKHQLGDDVELRVWLDEGEVNAEHPQVVRAHISDVVTVLRVLLPGAGK